ncbi:CHAP domain-containing protein [Terrarubrum flagellatum]|uniref:CHAP domain-containing protein n=1 Tax=Terrirubrum flagellatum TaxID=2895980 RepID=UPI003144E020
MSLPEDIVNWALARMNQIVGNGQCWTLAEQALAQNGGRTSTQIMGHINGNQNYVWGDPVADLVNGLRPGDILQFRNYRWNDNSIVRTIHPDGSWQQAGTSVQTRSHHTAIVEAVISPGVVDVLEQNAPPGSRVHRTRLRLVSFSGPMSETTLPSGDRIQTTPVHVIDSNSQVWAYHPQPAAQTATAPIAVPVPAH